jgi:DNA-binding CsgD family transcriptional regulator
LRDLGRGYAGPGPRKSEETLELAAIPTPTICLMEAEVVRREALELLAAGAAAEALATLEAGAERVAGSEPPAAAGLLVDAVAIALTVSGPERAVSTARRAVEAAASVGGLQQVLAVVRLGDALSWAGRYEEATPVWRRAALEAWAADPRMLAERANAFVRLGDAASHDAAYRALVAARATGEAELVLDALNLVTVAEVQAGRLREALRAAEQGFAEVRGSGTADEVDTIGLMAWVTALLGDEQRCRDLIAAAVRGLAELRITAAPGGHAQGLLELSLGAAAEAVLAFESKLAELGFGPVAAMTALRPFAADLVEAYVRAGRMDDARRVLAATLPVAVRSGQPRLAAPMLRAQGLVEEDEDAFARSFEAHGRWANRFEEGRTRLAFGELLRRRRRRAEARGHLAAAAAAFEQLSATIWHDRAIAELRLAGARTPARRSLPRPGREALTRQEGEILELLRIGLSNRAIAERLVLSVKTVEGHLTTIYGKFGVTSRTQMVAVLAGTAETDPGSG